MSQDIKLTSIEINPYVLNPFVSKLNLDGCLKYKQMECFSLLQTPNGSALATLSDQAILHARQLIEGQVELVIAGQQLSDRVCNTAKCNPPAPDNMTCAGRDILYLQRVCTEVSHGD